jgi:hypothetical protein
LKIQPSCEMAKKRPAALLDNSRKGSNLDITYASQLTWQMQPNGAEGGNRTRVISLEN